MWVFCTILRHFFLYFFSVIIHLIRWIPHVECVRLYVDIKIYFTEYRLMENVLSLLKKKMYTSCILAFFYFIFFFFEANTDQTNN